MCWAHIKHTKITQTHTHTHTQVPNLVDSINGVHLHTDAVITDLKSKGGRLFTNFAKPDKDEADIYNALIRCVVGDVCVCACGVVQCDLLYVSYILIFISPYPAH
jgi:hypothetical protein